MIQTRVLALITSSALPATYKLTSETYSVSSKWSVAQPFTLARLNMYYTPKSMLRTAASWNLVRSYQCYALCPRHDYGYHFRLCPDASCARPSSSTVEHGVVSAIANLAKFADHRTCLQDYQKADLEGGQLRLSDVPVPTLLSWATKQSATWALRKICTHLRSYSHSRYARTGVGYGGAIMFINSNLFIKVISTYVLIAFVSVTIVLCCFPVQIK